MLIEVLYSKLHRAQVTHCELNYSGSLGVDADLLEAAHMIAGQKVDVVNINNGERFSTYVIEEEAGSKRIGVYGAAARKAQVGDKIIIIAYAQAEPDEAKKIQPHIVICDQK